MNEQRRLLPPSSKSYFPFPTLPDEGDFCANPPAEEDQLLLNQVVRYYHKRLKRSLQAQQFLLRLGLEDAEVISTFKLGFSDRTLCHKLPSGRTIEGAATRGRLQRLGILRPTGHELFRGSLTVPILDTQGNVVDVYGRKVSNDQRTETPLQVSLFDPPRGVFNVGGLRGQKEIILCSGLIDAITYWYHGLRNVTATLGLKGLTPEHLDTFQALGIKRVVIAFERTKLADDEGRLVAQALDAVDIEPLRIDLPQGLDANTYAKLKRPTKGTLADQVREAKPFRQSYDKIVEAMRCARTQSH